MNRYRTLILTAVTLHIFLLPVFCQNDIDVKLNCENPNKIIFEIKNISDYKIKIWMSKEREGNSELLFDFVTFRNDTIKNCFRELYSDSKELVLILEPKQVYSISLGISSFKQLIKATIFIKYYIHSPKPRGGFYQRDFIKEELRHSGVLKLK